MAYTVNDHWICLEGAKGADGADGTATLPAAIFGLAGAGPGVQAPPGAKPGDIVFNPATGVPFQVGPTNLLVENTRTSVGFLPGPTGMIKGPIGIAGVTGPTGQPGAIADHTHAPDVDVLYVPDTYDAMWKQSYIPVKPSAPEIVGVPTLTNGVGNDAQVKVPKASDAGDPHPFRPDVRFPMPSVGYSLLRVVVYRSVGAPTNTTPWLDTPDRVDFADVINPLPGATLVVPLSGAWPGSGADSLWVVAYVWDDAGNMSPASKPVKATISYTTPPMPDRTPPQAPKVSVRWNPATQDYTVTVTAPSDPDVKEVRVWQNPSSTDPTTFGLIPNILPSTPGQVHTFTFKPALPPFPASYPPPRWRWASGNPHWVIEASWYAVAYDRNNNGSDPGLAWDHQPATDIIFDPTFVVPAALQPPPAIFGQVAMGGMHVIGGGGGGGGGGTLRPPVLPPKPPQPGQAGLPAQTMDTHMVKARSRAYDQSGARADAQWGEGIMHTGRYGSVHGTQWCGTFVDLSNLKGATIVSMTLKWTSLHTFGNAGGSYCVGYHDFENGMPSSLPGGSSHAHFGAFGHKHVPHTGGVTMSLPTSIAQKFADGQAYGFLFGGPHDSSQATYCAIDINSVHVIVKYRR